MFNIVNLSAYTSPQINESKNGEFVEYGSDNNYFNFLIERYLYSNTNNAIITGISNMIYGNGIDALDANKKPDEYAKMRSIIKPQCLKKIGLERKLLGMAAMQIGYDKNEVSFIDHFPMHTLRAEKCNDKGEIEAWYYHPDWSKYRKGDELKRIPAFGFGDKKDVEIFVIKPYVSGYHYYTPIDYSGALPYAKLEEEISDYLINDVQNGFSGTKIINFNNGIPPEENRAEIAEDVKRKVTGAKGQKTIVSFSNNKEQATDVIDIPLNDAPAHYEYLSKECFEKLVVGHRVTSPMLLGIRDNGGGFNNNSDEIETSALMFLNLVVKPYQQEIVDALDAVLAVNNINLNLRFARLQPLDSGQAVVSDNDIVSAINSLSPLVANKVLESLTANEIRDLVGLPPETGGSNLNPQLKTSFSAHTDPNLALSLIEKGEVLGNEWVLIDETEVDVDSENELDAEIEALNNKKQPSLLQKLASTITGRPNSKSDQDQNIDGVRFITRYKYSGDQTGERDFCKSMLSANKLYRKEDITNTNSNVVNPNQGHDGASYDLFLFKGGVNCKHKWLRQTYVSFDNIKIDVNNPNATQISTNKAESYGYRVRNPKEVAMRPIDMPNNGHHPNYKN